MTIRPFTPRAAARPAAVAAALGLWPQAVRAEEWQPARGHEPTLGDLIGGLVSGQGGALTAPLMLAALLLVLLVGLQALSSRS